MIPIVLIWGALLGFFYAAAHRTRVINLGGLAAVVGWLLLLFTIGDIGVRIEVIIFAAVLALMNYAVGVLIGWGVVKLLRSVFGMTAE